MSEVQRAALKQPVCEVFLPSTAPVRTQWVGRAPRAGWGWWGGSGCLWSHSQKLARGQARALRSLDAPLAYIPRDLSSRAGISFFLKQIGHSDLDSRSRKRKLPGDQLQTGPVGAS